MKYQILILLILLSALSSFGQSGYISTDSTISVGIKLIDGGEIVNAKMSQVKIRGGEKKTYSPLEIKEYGFSDGRVYISSEIQVSGSPLRVFLQQLYKGHSSLYFYRARGIKTFFLEKDSNVLVEISRRNLEGEKYQEQIADLVADCAQVPVAAKQVQYNKRSLTELISRYHECELKPFPHFRYGLTIGNEFTKLDPTNNILFEDLRLFDYDYKGGFSFGVFLDHPILVSDFSWHAEVNFSKNSFSFNKVFENRDLDLVAHFSSIKLPLLIRYSYPSNTIRPFVNLGMVGTYNYKSESYLYQSIFVERVIEISDMVGAPLVANSQLGYGVGAGVEYVLNFKHSLFFEVRYIKQYGLYQPETFSISNFKLTTGISF